MRAFMNWTIGAAALTAIFATMTGSSHAQAPNAMVKQYGYQFCNVVGPPPDSYRDCMYSTWEQCRAAAMPGGGCFENPAYIAARANAASAPAPRPQRTRH